MFFVHVCRVAVCLSTCGWSLLIPWAFALLAYQTTVEEPRDSVLLPLLFQHQVKQPHKWQLSFRLGAWPRCTTFGCLLPRSPPRPDPCDPQVCGCGCGCGCLFVCVCVWLSASISLSTSIPSLSLSLPLSLSTSRPLDLSRPLSTSLSTSLDLCTWSLHDRIISTCTRCARSALPFTSAEGTKHEHPHGHEPAHTPAITQHAIHRAVERSEKQRQAHQLTISKGSQVGQGCLREQT